MRVLILTSSTGGGHDMRARALRSWATRLTDWEVHIHQALEDTHPLYGFGVEVYNWIQRRSPRLHHIYFNALEVAGLHRGAGRMMGRSRFLSVVRDLRPDLVISTHAHLNHGFFELVRQGREPDPVRCVTYCGELDGGYGFSRHWVNPGADAFVGAVGETTEAARRLGMPPERAHTGGFLLEPAFYDPPPDDDTRRRFMREELALDPDRFTLLLATGVVGANNHLRLLDALASCGRPMQVVALCGRNAQTRSQVDAWRERQIRLSVRALPFFDRMPLLLRCVSAMVARPGTGATSEAVLSECPLVFNAIGGLMPQERITVSWAERNGFAHTIHSPRQIIDPVTRCENRPERLAEARARMRSAQPRRHPRDVLALAARGLQNVAASRIANPGRAG